MLKLACSRTLPFWWDNVSDFNALEALTVQTFNQVNIFHSAQIYPFLAVNINFCSVFFNVHTPITMKVNFNDNHNSKFSKLSISRILAIVYMFFKNPAICTHCILC